MPSNHVAVGHKYKLDTNIYSRVSRHTQEDQLKELPPVKQMIDYTGGVAIVSPVRSACSTSDIVIETTFETLHSRITHEVRASLAAELQQSFEAKSMELESVKIELDALKMAEKKIVPFVML